MTTIRPSLAADIFRLQEVERAAAEYGVFFAKGDPVGDGYTVDHTASLMAIDTDGKLRGKVKCLVLEHKTLENACATTDEPIVDADGVDRTSTCFAFANCSGF